MSEHEHQEQNSEFLRDLLGDDLYNELTEQEAQQQEEPAKIDGFSKADPEDEDVKLYDKRKLQKARTKLSPVQAESEKKSSIPPVLKTLLYIICVIGASIALALFVWVCADDVLALTGDDTPISFTVTEIDDLSSIAQRLKDKGLINHPLLFKLYGWFSSAEDKIEPGTYELTNVQDYRALVLNMVNYDPGREIVTVVIPEGFEQEQIFELLEENGVCDADTLAKAAASHDFEYDFLEGLETGLYNRLEGYLFPDTYDFYVDEDPVDVINKFLANFDRRINDDMKARIEVLNDSIREHMTEMYSQAYDQATLEADIEAHMLDLHDIVIIASLIEKEAANNSERSKISSVIHNRLISKAYPTLQIDATIQYILAERKDVLTSDDLSIDSPYNTYRNAGLPVGPIANPGLASIRAALYPDATEYYFYALDKDGTHHFSRTSEEHTQFLLTLNDDD